DVIVAYQGKEVSDSAMLRNEVADTPIHQEAKITVFREGHKVVLTAKIINLEDSIKVLEVTVDERLGVKVRDVNTVEANKFGIESNQGVVITRLDPKGPLGEAGFEIDDIILGINNQPIKGMEGFVTLVNMIPPKQKIGVMALDHRSGNTGMVEVVIR
ncbi:MAG: PDZ domain-containing protein, partial [Deltaproteobacteria bacterium]|nr:PDZ domain-containing protein [Deltaproteobacteria bacterium]